MPPSPGGTGCTLLRGCGIVSGRAGRRGLAWLALVVDALRSHVDHLDQLVRETGIIYAFPADPPELDEGARATLAEPGRSRLPGNSPPGRRAETLTYDAYKEIVAL